MFRLQVTIIRQTFQYLDMTCSVLTVWDISVHGHDMFSATVWDISVHGHDMFSAYSMGHFSTWT